MRRLLIALLGLATTGGVHAAEEVHARLLAAQDKLRPGATVQLAAVIEVAESWHINANPATAGLIATELKFDLPASVQVTQTDYPSGHQTKVGWSDETVALYTGKVTIFAEAHVKPDAAPGPVTIKATLRYQACDDEKCLAPKNIPLTWETEIVKDPNLVQPMHPDIFRTVGGSDIPVATGSEGSDKSIDPLIHERGLVLALVGVYLIGLGLNLTPCVYPMLSVTVSIFGAQTDSNTARVFGKALLYVLGMATMYSVLGLITSFTGGLFGGLLQQPWVLAGIAALLMVLALSMFGLYEIRPPAAVMNKLGGATSAGLAGVYVSGLVVGIFAAPCVGPPVLAVLATVATKGDPLFGFTMLFVMALGLGTPYLILGTFSGLLKKLPRSGAWMEWVKKIFGVVLLGVAAFYLALGFVSHLLHWILPATLLVGGIYLGFLEPTGRDKPAFRKMKQIFGALAIGVAVVLLANQPKGAPTWEAYSPDKLAAAAQAGRPVIIDFYADWCIPCHEMDKRTFTDPRVIEASKKFLMVKADLTKTGAPEVQALTDRFRIVGVPTFVFLGADGRERAEVRQVGFVPADQFLSVMDRALAATSTNASPDRATDGWETPPALLNRF